MADRKPLAISVRNAFRKLIANITRADAAWVYVLLLICLLMFFSFDTDSVKQPALVIMGVLASYLLLPDLEKPVRENITKSLPLHDIKVVAESLPPADLARYLGELGERVLTERANVAGPLAWKYGALPILETQDAQQSIIEDLNYNIRVSPGKGPDGFSLVRTRLSGKRWLSPVDGQVWVSFARTPEALENEYRSSGCLLRELIELDEATWQGVGGEQLGASFQIAGKDVVQGHREERHGGDLIRLALPLGPTIPLDRALDVRVNSQFLIPAGVRSFPVIFAAYYCLGRTQISFEVSEDGVVVEAFDFLGRQKDDHGIFRPLADKDAIDEQKSVSLSTTDTLLWPGTGVMFLWRRADEAQTWVSS